MEFKHYTFKIEFIDCPYDESLKAKTAELIKSIEKNEAPFSVKFELEVEKEDAETTTTTKSQSGLSDAQIKMFEDIENLMHAAAAKGGKKSKIKNEVEVDKEV